MTLASPIANEPAASGMTVARLQTPTGAVARGSLDCAEHSFGDCSSLETGATARDCRSRGGIACGNELLIAEHLNLNDQVYEGLRVFRPTQPGTLAELAQAPANTDLGEHAAS